MTTQNSPDPDDLIARVVNAFEQMPLPPAPSVDETFALLERRTPASPPQQPAAPCRPAFHPRRLSTKQRFAAAGAGLSAVLAASLAVVATWPLALGQPSIAQAFDKFAAVLVDARSATFQLEVTVEGHPKQQLQSYYLAPGKMRSEMTGFVTIANMRSGKTVNLLPEQKTALVMNIKGMSSEPGKPQFNDFFAELRSLLSKSRHEKEDGVKQLGEKEIDGRRVIGFRCDSPLGSMDLWGDPTTGLPVRVESVLNGIPRIEYTMSRFFFNGDLDPALFDTEPPVGYKIDFYDIDASKPTEVALIEGLRAATDLNDGRFPDDLNAVPAAASDDAPPDQQPKQAIGDKKGGPRDMTPEVMTIGRGMTFVAQLPESADSHYAGRGVKLGEPNRPIFWYKPEGAATYRVIYADLSIKEAERAPDVAAGPLVASQESTFQAFNMFAEALVEAKSAKFLTVSNIEGQKPHEAKSFHLAPCKLRDEGTDGTVDILDTGAGKRILLMPKEKRAVMATYTNRVKRPDGPQVIDIFEEMRDLLSDARDVKGVEYQQLGEKDIDGRHAIGFRCTSPLTSLTLWGEPATGLPVLVEVVWTGTPKNSITMSHFELNEKLDPALFDMTPPADYKVETVDIDMSKPTEQALVDALRLIADLNNGVFVDKLEGALVIKQALSDEQAVFGERKQASGDKTDDSKDKAPAVPMHWSTVARGIGFALKLPESADAHYAGKGVKRGAADRPIFWYKPEGVQTYRVIYADLSVNDADSAPEVAGAVRLEKPKPAESEKGAGN